MTSCPASTSSHPALSVRGLSAGYQGNPALERVHFALCRGRLGAVVGPNGAGKSTFLKTILGLHRKDRGIVLFFGRPVAAIREKMAYIPQRTSVDWTFPASALDIVTMGLYRKIGWCLPVRRKHTEKAMHCLEQVGLADIAERQIGRLSGGQQQRVFIARALAQDAEFYLMDEPFAGVDAATEHTILDLFAGLKRRNHTVLVVHHDLATVRDYFDDVLILNQSAVAAGPVGNVFTDDNLRKAYGGELLLGRGAQA